MTPRHPALMRAPRRAPVHPARGFTLLELLLATAIFSIVLLAIHTVFFAGLTLQRRATAALDESLPIQNALTVLRRDLENAVNPAGVLAGHFRVGGPASSLNSSSATVSGTANASVASANPSTDASLGGSSQTGGLDFFTSTGVLRDLEPGADLVEVNYQLMEPLEKTEKTWGMDLVRGITRNLLSTATQEPEEQRLLSNVESLEFEFYDGLDWRDTWDTSSADTSLPTAVRLSLLMATDPENPVPLREPIRMIVRLNPAPAASTNAVTEETNPGA